MKRGQLYWRRSGGERFPKVGASLLVLSTNFWCCWGWLGVLRGSSCADRLFPSARVLTPRTQGIRTGSGERFRMLPHNWDRQGREFCLLWRGGGLGGRVLCVAA